MPKWRYKEVVAHNHERTRANGCVLEHIIVAEQKLGRKLLPHEVVHHIDGDRQNNSDDNIMVFASQAHHARFHKTGIAYRTSNGSYITPELPSKKNRDCVICGIPCHNKYCSQECSSIAQRKVQRPGIRELELLIARYPMTTIGKMFDVSDNTVRKWAKAYGLKYKKRI